MSNACAGLIEGREARERLRDLAGLASCLADLARVIEDGRTAAAWRFLTEPPITEAQVDALGKLVNGLIDDAWRQAGKPGLPPRKYFRADRI